jgi:MFS family permease
VCGFHVGFYAVHIPAYVANLGLDSWVGATALTLVGLANIVGTYLVGRWSRYMAHRHALALIYLARSLVFLGLLLLPPTPFAILSMSALLGIFWLATLPLTSGLVATFFGTNWLALLFGIVSFSHQLGGFAGVWAAGVLFDATGSYDAMWQISLALGIVAALGRYASTAWRGSRSSPRRRVQTLFQILDVLRRTRGYLCLYRTSAPSSPREGVPAHSRMNGTSR